MTITGATAATSGNAVPPVSVGVVVGGPVGVVVGPVDGDDAVSEIEVGYISCFCVCVCVCVCSMQLAMQANHNIWHALAIASRTRERVYMNTLF